MNETTLTVTGNLTTDPELRFTASGDAVANFTVANTPRRFDKTTGEWVDQEPVFLRCTLWRAPAESLTRGARVIVTGRLRANTWETREGEKRTTLQLDVDDIGASLKFALLTVRAPQRTTATAEAPGSEEPPF